MTLKFLQILRFLLWGPVVALTPVLLAPQPAPPEKVVELAPQVVAPGEVTLEVSLELPPGWQLTPGAPQSVRLSVQDPRVLRPTPAATAALGQPRFPVSLPLTGAPGRTVLSVDLLLNLCRTDGLGMCLIRETRLMVPVTVAEGAPARVLKVPYALRAP